jgi:hypothetical protein
MPLPLPGVASIYSLDEFHFVSGAVCFVVNRFWFLFFWRPGQVGHWGASGAAGPSRWASEQPPSGAWGACGASAASEMRCTARALPWFGCIQAGFSTRGRPNAPSCVTADLTAPPLLRIFCVLSALQLGTTLSIVVSGGLHMGPLLCRSEILFMGGPHLCGPPCSFVRVH